MRQTPISSQSSRQPITSTNMTEKLVAACKRTRFLYVGSSETIQVLFKKHSLHSGRQDHGDEKNKKHAVEFEAARFIVLCNARYTSYDEIDDSVMTSERAEHVMGPDPSDTVLTMRPTICGGCRPRFLLQHIYGGWCAENILTNLSIAVQGGRRHGMEKR